MTRLALIVLIVILALLGYFLVKQTRESEQILQQDEEQVMPTTTENLDFDFHNWHLFSSPNETFKVLLPTLPQHATENITDPKSQAVRKYDMYVSEKPDGTVFMISLVTFPDIPKTLDDKKLLTAIMNDMVATNPNNELKTVESGEYNGHPSLDFTMGNQNVTINAKSFLVGNTLYVLSRIVKKEDEKSNEYNFFINSFELSPQNGAETENGVESS